MRGVNESRSPRGVVGICTTPVVHSLYPDQGRHFIPTAKAFWRANASYTSSVFFMGFPKDALKDCTCKKLLKREIGMEEYEK